MRIGSSRFDTGGRVVGVSDIFVDNYKPNTVENDIGKIYALVVGFSL